VIARRGVLAGLASGSAAAASARPAAFLRRDLTGLWTNATYTDLERPKELTKAVMTAAEAEAWEAPRRPLGGMKPSAPDDIGQAESEFNERGDGMLRINGEIRTSLVVDPPDGRIPYTPEAVQRLGIGAGELRGRERLDNPEERPMNERCLISMGSAAPMLSGPDTNHYRFVQTRAELAIWCEKYHEVRIIRLGQRHDGGFIAPSFAGDSVGEWQGDTLVVETIGLKPQVQARGGRLFVSGATRVVERLTRTGAGEIDYAFTVEDPSLYIRPWRGETLFRAAKGEIYEYACHEGNYALPAILATARQEERAAR
jgi:hypothetical protein